MFLAYENVKWCPRFSVDDWVDMSGPSSPPVDSHMPLHDLQKQVNRVQLEAEANPDNECLSTVEPSENEAAQVSDQTEQKLEPSSQSHETHIPTTATDKAQLANDSLAVADSVAPTDGVVEQTHDSSSDSSIVVVRGDELCEEQGAIQQTPTENIPTESNQKSADDSKGLSNTRLFDRMHTYHFVRAMLLGCK